MKMKSIDYKDYDYSGVLIDLEDKISFQNEHFEGAINIPLSKLISSYKTILSKDKKYYFYCTGGVKSRKATMIFSSLGFDVTQVIKQK